jgi:hypothetical protein
MVDYVRITVDDEGLRRLGERFTTELVNRAAAVVSKYTAKVRSEARKIIEEEGYRDTGELIRRIHPSLAVYVDRVVGEVNAVSTYARFIHEGAEHVGDNIAPHFVSFKTAPGLLTWAKRHGIIEFRNGNWYFIDKNNQEHLISDINKSGLSVMARATKFFEKPFDAEKGNFIAELSGLVGGVNA